MSINWDSKVLSSVVPVIENLSHLSLDEQAIISTANKLSNQDYGLNYVGDSSVDPQEYIRKIMFINTLNFVFTDFTSQIKYQYNNLSDTDAFVYQIDEAIKRGVPLFDGSYMRDMSLDDFTEIFTGNMKMPMSLEKVEILNVVGDVLVNNYKGDWLNFINNGPKKLYASGEGLVERLISEFDRFNDSSQYHNNRVYFLKLAQLAFWGMHRELSSSYFFIEDMENMTAFADYIIPVALESFEIVHYSEELKEKIQNGIMIERDSTEEIEIRATTIYVTAKLTEEINKLKNFDEQIIIPQLDFKLWTQFHADKTPHHLTKTIMY